MAENESPRPINRVIIYMRGENDEWGENVVALADIQIRFPYGTLSAIKCIPIVKTGATSYGLLIPTTKVGVISVPVFKGKELMSALEAAVLGTFNKVVGQGKPGETWEQSRANDEVFFGKTEKEYSNAQYRYHRH